MLFQPGALSSVLIYNTKIDGFLKRSYRYGFTKEIFHIQTIIESVTYDLFNTVTYYLLNDHSMMHSESEDISSNYITAYTNFTNNLSL